MKHLVFMCMVLFAATQSFAAENTGRVHGVLFEDEQKIPIGNVTLFSQQYPDTVVEIEDGNFDMVLPEGRHTLLVYMGGGTVAKLGEVDVVAGYDVEVVGSVSDEGEVTSYQVEGITRVAHVEEDSKTSDKTKQMSVILGKVVHEETGEGVKGVRVFVRGESGYRETDENGQFVFEVPVGVHDVSAIHQQFATVTQNNVSVVAEKPTEIELVVTPLGVMLSDFVVTAPRIEGGTASLMEERKESTAVEDVIGAEQMSKTGDSNAASALKRVTGITVVGGKYVYVRGLGERYSSTLFNGAMLPSPEPERRVIPLDMFPAGMLESVVVQKTYSPEMPGEFGGGVVLLRSRNYPSEFVFDVSLSGEILTGTTFTQGWMNPSGPTDWLGVDGGHRSLPGEFVEATEGQPLVEGDLITPGFSLEEIEELGELLPQQWKTWKDTIPPNFGGSVSVGNTFKLRKLKLGVLGSAMYDNDWESVEPHFVVYNMGQDDMRIFHDYDFENTVNTIKTSGFLALGVEFSEHHSLRSTTILNRITDNQTRWYRGLNSDVDTDIRVLRIRWVERQLFSQQLLGEHLIQPLHDLGFNWRYTYSRATRDEPLRREARYDLERDTGRWRLSNRPEGNSTLFSELVDVSHDLGFEFSMPFRFDEYNELKLFGGGAFVIREREVDTRRFNFNTKKTNSFPAEEGPLSLWPEDLFVDEYIGPFTYDGTDYAGLEIREATRPTDNYTAEQTISAGYTKGELQLMEDVKLMAGARVEKSVQKVRTFELFTATPQTTEADLETLDVLPAGTASWEFIEGMIVRGGYGRTVSRPEFRELSEAPFNDVTGGRETVGNPDLKRATIDNFDVRWDWFFAPGELISFGGFFKRFEDPIEVSLIQTAQIGTSWRNARGAKNVGLEFDFKKSFNWISEALQDMYFATNASFIRSRVELDPEGIQTTNERPLQGQSPFVINAQVGYDDVDSGLSLVLLYNVFGRRISEVGAVGLPDTYEQPFHQMNFVAKKKFKKHYQLSFKIGNILNQAVEFKQGGHTTFYYKKGVSFSLGAGYSY
ncbi:MAG: TonB-dependent receptor [Deltaproteobacteria bacterium]|nr:TonB-dependent receptor [Deltaproteobacteria bacterium]MBN2671533.1 TonB-dependent receptor [Deltaproteobacteria bacterium]